MCLKENYALGSATFVKTEINISHMSRPLFLSVVCIVTFVFSGLGLLGSVWGVAPSSIDSGLQAMREMRSTELDFVSFNESEYLKWTFYSNVAGIIGGVLCLIGAFAMWRLNRIGYFIYIIGYLVTIIVGFLALIYISQGSSAGTGKGIFVLNVLAMIAFFIMYGKNLKHMK